MVKLILLLIATTPLTLSAGVFPGSMSELYCIKQHQEEKPCLNVDMETAYCFNTFSPIQCRELRGEDLCKRTPRSSEECASVNLTTGMCYLEGYTTAECQGVTAGKLICKKTGRGFKDCANLSDAEVMCLRAGFTTEDCSGIKPAEVLCLDLRRDMSYCKGVTANQIPCVKKGYSKDQIAKECR